MGAVRWRIRRLSWRTWGWVGLVLILLAGAAMGAVAILDGDDGVSNQSNGGKDPDDGLYPDQWSARVQPYVDIVESERDLDFRHPVRVEFLTVEEFRRKATDEKSGLTDDEREEIKQATGLLRAVGLVEGRLDLFEATNDVAGAGIIGYYSYKDERIRVRGTTLTPATKSTLVHELTHALQDQHFGLKQRQDELRDDNDTAGATAFRALVEGDASRIETAYRASLPVEERAELDEEQQTEAEAYERKVADLPEIIGTFFAAPYVLGEAMLELAVVKDGNDAVDALFQEPPTTEEHLLDPWTLVEDHDRAVDVREPELGAGDVEFDAGPFGALTWYLLLAERIPAVEALDAADGWGGDAYVAFERDGASCVRVHYSSDSGNDLNQMHDALRAWVAALPSAPASVEREGTDLVFESCDPGPTADVGSDSSGTALQLAAVRTRLASAFLEGWGDEKASRCFGDVMVHSFSPRQLAEPDLGADTSTQNRIRGIAFNCLS